MITTIAIIDNNLISFSYIWSPLHKLTLQKNESILHLTQLAALQLTKIFLYYYSIKTHIFLQDARNKALKIFKILSKKPTSDSNQKQKRFLMWNVHLRLAIPEINSLLMAKPFSLGKRLRPAPAHYTCRTRPAAEMLSPPPAVCRTEVHTSTGATQICWGCR